MTLYLYNPSVYFLYRYLCTLIFSTHYSNYYTSCMGLLNNTLIINDVLRLTLTPSLSYYYFFMGSSFEDLTSFSYRILSFLIDSGYILKEIVDEESIIDHLKVLMSFLLEYSKIRPVFYFYQ